MYACKEEQEACNCEDVEVCKCEAYSGINECDRKESVFWLGGTCFIAPNAYRAVSTQFPFLDTLVFYNDTTRSLDDERFGLMVENAPEQVWNVMGSQSPYQYGPKEYSSQTVAPVCYVNGIGWYANVHFWIEPDSVVMNLKFWTLYTSPGEIIDSCSMVFKRKT